MAHFIPIARVLTALLLNRVCFRLKPLPSASESPVRASSVYLCRSGRDLFLTAELLAECVYLLVNMTYIEAVFLSASEDTTVLPRRRTQGI